MMLSTLALTLALVSTSPADTIVLQPGGFFLWFRRPTVRLILDTREDGSSRRRLTLTARDPQFFTTATLQLFFTADLAQGPFLTLSSDSSSVDARSSMNRHTLWFVLSQAQLTAWAGGDSPTLRIGNMKVRLDDQGRERLRSAVRPDPPAPSER